MRRLTRKRAAEMPARRQLTADLIRQARGQCQMGTPVCETTAVCLHERRKRSSGGSILVAANCVVSCRTCNSWVEDNPAKARIARALDGRSLVVREGDADWHALGRYAEVAP